jgi:NitT/TauT family transport system ATP-binding protein
MSAPAVSLNHLAIAFGLKAGGRYTAVEAIDLAVAPGEFVAIVGPTGCGKSTLLNAAAGLIRPFAGAVTIFGTPLSGLNPRAGYLFQQDALMPWKTALDNVAVALEPQGVASADARSRAKEWLRRVGLSAFTERYPHMLSGGQKKRVALAQVLIRDPEILLMDEPFGPLDAQTRQIMGNLLLDLWALNRKAVLFVTHDLEEAIALADRVVVMSAGPAARIIGDFRVALPRPRDIAEVRLEPAFHHITRKSGRACAPRCKGPTRRGRRDEPDQDPRPASRRRPCPSSSVARAYRLPDPRPAEASAVLLLDAGGRAGAGVQGVRLRRDLAAPLHHACRDRARLHLRGGRRHHLRLLFARRELLAAVFDPYIKAANALPRVVLAPIFALWFGLGIWSKVALGFTLVFLSCSSTSIRGSARSHLWCWRTPRCSA